MRKRAFRKILSGSLCFALLLALFGGISPLQINAATSSQLQGELDKLEEENDALQAQIDALRGQMNGNLTELQALMEQKDLVDQEIALLYEQMEVINNQITTCAQLIADKQEELDAAQQNLKELQNQNALRIRAMEENGELSYWAVLAQANSIMDMLDCLEMMADVKRADDQCMRELQEAAQVVEEARAALADQQDSLQAKRDALDGVQVLLQQRRAETDALLIEMKAKGDEYEEMMAQLEDQQNQLALEILEKTKEFDEALEREQAATKPATGPVYDNGLYYKDGIAWMMPCKYTMFTSPFGMRIHPIHGDWRMHEGVDLAGYESTPIVATRAGYVTVAARNSAAGNYVALSHGDGYGSIYMHMTHYIVSAGQYVQQGQVIGYMGDTGGSNGVHLHFGISKNYVYVNPAEYINFPLYG